ENEIFARMETRAIRPATVPPGEPWPNPATHFTSRPPVSLSPTPAPVATPNSSSFLDEWLTKKRQLPSTPLGTPPSPAASFSPQSMSNTPTVPPTSYPLPQQSAVALPKANAQPNAASENISSEMLDQNEAQRIARELEVNLRPKDVSANPVKPQLAVDESLALKELQHDDTIYIDKEGNFQTLKPAES
ncbi:hypothetical protein M1512_01460, partial [Patescibacteria group bacterium]|nr:hypothetical protein [Patescibacteria group bacterium]